MNDKKELEVISGDGSSLDISPVYEHLNAARPKANSEKPKNIVIPNVNSKKKDDDEEDDDKDDDTENELKLKDDK